MPEKTWTPDETAYGLMNYVDGRQMIDDKDIDLDKHRAEINAAIGRATTLSSDQLLVLVMSADDDYGNEWYVDRLDDAEIYFNDPDNIEALSKLIDAAGLVPLTMSTPPAPEADAAVA